MSALPLLKSILRIINCTIDCKLFQLPRLVFSKYYGYAGCVRVAETVSDSSFH